LDGAHVETNMPLDRESYGTRYYGGEELPKKAAVVMTYTGHLAHASHEPATFVVAAEEGRIAPPSIMEERVAALREMGTAVEYHKIRKVGHGFRLGRGTHAEGWIERGHSVLGKALPRKLNEDLRSAGECGSRFRRPCALC
jgi:hypothetical protein